MRGMRENRALLVFLIRLGAHKGKSVFLYLFVHYLFTPARQRWKKALIKSRHAGGLDDAYSSLRRLTALIGLFRMRLEKKKEGAKVAGTRWPKRLVRRVYFNAGIRADGFFLGQVRRSQWLTTLQVWPWAIVLDVLAWGGGCLILFPGVILTAKRDVRNPLQIRFISLRRWRSHFVNISPGFIANAFGRASVVGVSVRLLLCAVRNAEVFSASRSETHPVPKRPGCAK